MGEGDVGLLQALHDGEDQVLRQGGPEGRAGLAEEHLRKPQLLAVLALLGCAGPDWATAETRHLVLRYERGSYAERHLKEAKEVYEEALAYAAAQLPFVKPEQTRFTVYLHEDLASAGHANRSDRSVHYTFSEKIRLTSAHEMMHHLLYEANPAMPLRFEEGVCRLFESRSLTKPDGTTVACQLSQLAKAAPKSSWTLEQVFADAYHTDEEGNVACAGAAFLMKELGKPRFWDFYKQTTRETVRGNLERFLGADEAERDRRFAAFVEGLPAPPPELMPRKP